MHKDSFFSWSTIVRQIKRVYYGKYLTEHVYLETLPPPTPKQNLNKLKFIPCARVFLNIMSLID